jgi:hypothetical protein
LNISLSGAVALTLPEPSRAGDTMEVLGTGIRVTFEYGAFAAEPEPGAAR